MFYPQGFFFVLVENVASQDQMKQLEERLSHFVLCLGGRILSFCKAISSRHFLVKGMLT